MLISSLLLSYPAVGVASYIVGFPLRDTTTGLAQTVMIPAGARLPVISGPLNAGFVIIALIAALVIFVDRRTVFGYELRMRGANLRFAGYGGVRLARQTIQVMFASGADRRAGRRHHRARLAVPLHRRRAADAGLHLVRADGGAARRAASRSARSAQDCSSRRCRPAASPCSARHPCRACSPSCCSRSSSSSSPFATACGGRDGHHHALPHAVGRAGDHADPACGACRRALRPRRRLQHGARRADADRRLRRGRRQLLSWQRARRRAGRDRSRS